jgi:hypothetical protein
VSPFQSAATQNEAVRQETDSMPPPLGSMEPGADHDPPFDVRRLPLQSTAAQSEAEGQDTEVTPPRVSMPVGTDHDFPFHRRALPSPSTVMQNDADRQETEVRTPAPLSDGTGRRPRRLRP